MRFAGVSLLMVILCFLSCTDKDNFKDGIVQMKSQPISLPLDKMRCMWDGKDTVLSEGVYDKELKLVVYSDTTACSSCGLKTMYLWDEFIEAIEAYGEEISLYFVFAPLKKDLDNFYFTMRTTKLSIPVYVDTMGVFMSENRHIPERADFHTFLLDKDNNVVLVGNPSKNERIWEMFWQIVEERLGKREMK